MEITGPRWVMGLLTIIIYRSRLWINNSLEQEGYNIQNQRFYLELEDSILLMGFHHLQRSLDRNEAMKDQEELVIR